MLSFYYLLSLIISIACLLLVDWRYKLLFFAGKRPVWPLLLGMGFFLLWDITGIVLDIFSTNQALVTGLHVVVPDLPIEEFFFLFLLCYLSALVLAWQHE